MRIKLFALLSLFLVAIASRLTEIQPAPNIRNTRRIGAQNRLGVPNEASSISKARVAESYGKLPLSFEANQGQAGSEVKFVSRGGGYTLFLTGNEAVLELRKPGAGGQKPEAAPAPKVPAVNSRYAPGIRGTPRFQPAEPGAQHQVSTPQGVDELASLRPSSARRAIVQAPSAPAVVRMKLVGANPSPKVTGLDELPGKSNYFIGNDPKKWRTNVPNYAKVKYSDVYPGIDLVYYGNQQQLEYDLVVAPGANPEAIRLSFDGAEKIETSAEGDLLVGISGEEVRLRKPVVYQQEENRRREVSGSYVLEAKNEVGFRLAAYDVARPVVIDPTLVYSSFLGGDQYDANATSWNNVANGVAVDWEGSVYVTGETGSSGFPVTSGAFQTAIGGVNYILDAGDAFISKLNASGTALLYSTFLGGSGGDGGTAIAVDMQGSAYITGFTGSSNFPAASPIQPGFGGGSCPIGGGGEPTNCRDAFVAKLNSTGDVLVYSSFLGGSGDDLGYGIALDPSGAAYVAGQTASTNFPITPGAFQPVLRGGANTFLAKVDPAGSSLVYSTYIGGSGSDSANAIAVDGLGNAYTAGTTSSKDFPTTSGSLRTAFAGAFVLKLNVTGSLLVYSTFLGGSGGTSASAIAVDSTGSAYITGSTGSTDFPTTPGAFQTGFNPAVTSEEGTPVDAFVTKLNATGSALVYSTYLGGESGGTGIAVDTSGNCYIVGYNTLPSFPLAYPIEVIYPGERFSHSYGSAVFVSELNPSGSGLLFSSFLGGNAGGGTAAARAVALDALGAIYIAGSTTATNFPVTPGVFQPASQIISGSGASDGFIAKIDPINNPTAAITSISPTTVVAGSAGITLTVTGSNFIGASEIFWNGSARPTTFVSLTSLTAAISASDLAVASLAQVTVFNPPPAGGSSNALSFTVGTNPLPQLTSLNPSSATAGSQGFLITVSGSAFLQGAMVQWNGSNLPTTFQSSTQLLAAVPTTDLAAPGTAQVTVFNPAPGGGTSNALTFTTNPPGSNPIPVLSSLSPSSAAPSGAIPGLITTVAGNGTAAYSGDNGAAVNAAFNEPAGLAVDSAGNIYIADTLNSQIRRVAASTGIITTVAGNGTAGYSGDNGLATAAELNFPVGLTLDSAGNIYIADERNQRIRKVTVSTGIITTVAGNGTLGFFSGDGGPATSAELNQPYGAAVDSGGNIYIADTANQRVRKVMASTGIITTVAGNGTLGFSGDNGPATGAELNSPYAVVLDPFGNIYISDASNNRIREVTASTGIITTVVGNGKAGYSGDNGPATNAELSAAGGVALDSAGNIFIADYSNQRVRGVNLSTGIITTVAGDGTSGYSGDNGPATSAELKLPNGVAADSAGNIYIADTGNNRIREVFGSPSGLPGPGDFMLSVTGLNFVSGATVEWNGSPRTTSFVSGSELYAWITAADIATVGTAQVTVVNPTPGGGTSGPLTFTVTSPGTGSIPSIVSLSPSSAVAGSLDLNLFVNGSNFAVGALVQWNGINVSTSDFSTTQLGALVPAAYIATPGTAQVTVVNPGPFGGTSAPAVFMITAPVTNPLPTITSLATAVPIAGGIGYTLTVNGTNFVPASVVQWNGSNRVTTFVSVTQLSALLNLSDLAPGTAQVTVLNPSGVSNSVTYTANPNPPGSTPTLTSLAPSAVVVGGPAFTLTVNGSNFASGSVVQWNGSNRTTTFVSSAQLTAAITANDIATIGSAQVTVFNAPPGGISNTLAFTVSATIPNTIPVVSSLNPGSAVAGGAAFSLTVTGSNFVTGSVVLWNGQSRSTNFVNATQLTAAITAADIAATGTAQVSVFNPGTGGGLSNALPFIVVVSSPCTYSLSPNSASYLASAGTGGLQVTTTNGCGWSAASNVSWIVLTASIGSGQGDVFYSFGANTSTGARTGLITVAGQTFTITQAGATPPSGTTSFQPALNIPLNPGFYIAEVTLAPGAAGGAWGVQVLTSLGQSAGGFNLGGGVPSGTGNPGFGAFLLTAPETVIGTLNAQGSPGTQFTVRFLDSNRQLIGSPVTGASPLTLTDNLATGFYVVEVYSSAAVPFNFQLGLAANFFSGGMDAGGYLGQGQVGFGAFYVPVGQTVSIQAYGRATYGAAGAGDLILTLRDANRNIIQVVSP